MSEEIDSILNGNEPAVEAPVETAAETPTPEVASEPEVETEGPARGPDGKFIAKGETTDAEPASKTDYDPGPVIAERKRRQEAERRAEDAEQRLQQALNPPQPAIDMFEDPEGRLNQFGGQLRQQTVQEASFNSLLNTSEMLCRDKFDDFDDAKAKFMALAESNPVLAQQALGDAHPWRKAYQIVKNHEKMEALGATDAQSLEAKLREQIRAELEAEQKAQPAAVIPNSLATAQSGMVATTPGAPPSLADILNAPRP
jgi:hypothetical protein